MLQILEVSFYGYNVISNDLLQIYFASILLLKKINKINKALPVFFLKCSIKYDDIISIK